MECAFNNGSLGEKNIEMLFPRCSSKNVAHTVAAVGWSSCSTPPHMVLLVCGRKSKQEMEGTARSEAALPGLILTLISEAGNYTRCE